MRDGVELVADHYRPLTSNPGGTLLVRGPYGRGYPVSVLFGSVYASRGYHVVVQSVRGTFGSGGDFESVRARGRRRRRHRRVAARPALVHRLVRHRGCVLPRLHPVGAADRPAAGDGGRGHHRRTARHQRAALGHRFIRAQRLPRLERRRLPPGGSRPFPDRRANGSGQAAGRHARPAGLPLGEAGRTTARRGRAVVRVVARAPGARRPVLGADSAALRAGAHARSPCCCSPAGRTCSSSRRWSSTHSCAGATCRWR